MNVNLHGQSFIPRNGRFFTVPPPNKNNNSKIGRKFYIDIFQRLIILIFTLSAYLVEPTSGATKLRLALRLVAMSKFYGRR